MKIVLGLGNPGEKYLSTRHNLGFTALSEYAKKVTDQNWSQENKWQSQVLKLPDLLLVKPLTYMNNSGMAVLKLVDFYKLPPEDLMVVHDELDLQLGKIKIRLGGGTGGHKGVESVMKALGTEQFIRIRLGIGNERSHSGEHKRIHFNADRFVLESFMPGERSKVKHMLKQAVKALDILINQGLETAQNQYN